MSGTRATTRRGMASGNLPPRTGSIQGGFKAIRALTAQDTHKPRCS